MQLMVSKDPWRQAQLHSVLDGYYDFKCEGAFNKEKTLAGSRHLLIILCKTMQNAMYIDVNIGDLQFVPRPEAGGGGGGDTEGSGSVTGGETVTNGRKRTRKTPIRYAIVHNAP